METRSERPEAYAPVPGRVVRSVGRYLLLLVVLLFLPVTKASANHFHYIPITDSRYSPNTLYDLFGEAPLQHWIVWSGSDVFSFVDDTDNIYSVSDGSGGAETAFDFPFFDDVSDITGARTAHVRFLVNSLPGSGDPSITQTIEVGFTDLATVIKWDEAQGAISATKGGFGADTVSSIPAWNQGQLLPWEVNLYYNFTDYVFTGTINGLSWSWSAAGSSTNPFSYFYPFSGTDPDNLDMYFYVQCDDQCEIQMLDWGILACDTQAGTAVDTATCGQDDLATTVDDGQSTVVPTPSLSVTYTITAQNLGPVGDKGVTVTDAFPASLQSCTWTCVPSTGATCSASGSGDINDNIQLAANAEAVYTATCVVDPAATGSINDTAEISGTNTDTVPGNNSATDSDPATPIADLGIIKNDGRTTAVPGGGVTYVITATNYGPSNASGATVSDTFPTALSCNWSCFGTGAASCPATGSGNIAAQVDLPVGATSTFFATCAIDAAATGTLTNTAAISPPSSATDPVSGNDSASDSDALTLQATEANLGILDNDGQSTAVSPGTVRYVVTAINFGPSGVTGAMVNDTFSTSLTCTWNCYPTGGASCAASGSGNIAQSVDLPVESTVSFFADCTLDPNAAGPLLNVATISAPGGTSDPDSGNNSATDSDTIIAASALAVPTLDNRALAALLAALLAGTGWLFLRRH